MLTVTEAARTRLSRRLIRKKAADDMAMRIVKKAKGWNLRMDRLRPADTAIAHEGRNLLLLDEAVLKATTNMTLDVKKTDEGQRLSMR
jgi:hypothetical protein